MQAAVVSVLLMAGACGNSGEPLPAPGSAMVTASQPAQASACSYSTQYPSPGGGIYECVGPFGCAHYSPVWLLKDCAAYYPGNYAVPYDYREQFNYPWHGPRPLPAGPAIELQTAAKPSAKPAAKQAFRAAAAPRAGSRSIQTAK